MLQSFLKPLYQLFITAGIVFLMTLKGYSQAGDPVTFSFPPNPVTKISAVEYFFDTDPGLGKAFPIAVSEAKDIELNNVTISGLNSLSPGVHKLFVRSRNTAGAWGITNSAMFFLQSQHSLIAPSIVEEINRAEYFFNQDPGVGKGNPIHFTAARDVELNNVVITGLEALPSGMHTLFVRTQSVNGTWSITNAQLFFILPQNELISPTHISQITQAEYFFNVDPGVGKGSSIPVGSGADIELNNVVISGLDLLPPGMNQLYIRTRNEKGNWSQTNNLLFFIAPKQVLIPPSITPMITEAEYFFNTDPGFGKGTQISLSPHADVNLNNVVISGLENLNPGLNNLFIRTKNERGNWSLTNMTGLFISSSEILIAATPAPANISEIEYYINTDPGQGNGIKIPVNGNPDISDLAFQVDMTGINPGEHKLFIRVKNEKGSWSTMVVEPFTVHLPVPNDIQVLSLELKDGACLFTESTNIQVKLFNGGDNALSGFAITCEIDGVAFATETVMDEILPGKEYLFTFNKKANLSQLKTFHFRIYTSLPNDDRPENDTISKSVTHHASVDKGVSSNVSVCYGEQVTLSAFGGVKYQWAHGSASNLVKVTPTEATTYYVTITDKYGCVQYDSVTVSVLPALTAPVISSKGDNKACFEQAVTLITDIGTKVKWYRITNGQQIYLSESDTLVATVYGEYIAKLTNEAGCEVISEKFLVNILPEVSISVDPMDAICKGSSVTLSVNNAAIYSWSTGDTTQSITLSPEVTTTYYVSGSNAAGCTFSDSVTISVLPATPPAPATNLIPGNLSINLDVPIDLSWSPSSNASHYDLFIWKDGESKPSTAKYRNIKDISYSIRSGLDIGTTYHWMVLSKNSCFQTESAVHTFTTGNLPDLIINSFEVTDNTVGGDKITVKYEVKNIGEGGTRGAKWKDRIWLSSDLDLRKADDILLGEFDNFSYLQPGESYVQTKELTIPKNISGTYYLFIITDNEDAYCMGGRMEDGNCSGERGKHSDNVKESNEQNNFVYSLMTIRMAPLPDLYVKSIGVPTDVFSNDRITVQYQIGNKGDRPALSDMYSFTNCHLAGGNSSVRFMAYYWTDQVYISPDPEFNINNAKRLSTHPVYIGTADNQTCTFNNPALAVDSSHNSSVNVTIPNEYNGTYYIYVLTNYTGVIESNYSNNLHRSEPITVRLTPPADLVVENIEIPATVYSGEMAAIKFNVKNEGANAPIRNGWKDKIYISKNASFNPDSALLVGTRIYGAYDYGNLTTGKSYSVQGNYSIPRNISGEYYVYIYTDAENVIFEYNKEDNNIGRSSTTMNIGFGPRPDLIVKNIQIPDTITRGRSFPIKWAVENIGTASVENSWTDQVYWSGEKVFNSNAKKMSTFNQSTKLQPGEVKETSLMVLLPSGAPDSITFFIETDFEDKIYELNETNNVLSTRDGIISIPVIMTPPPAPIKPDSYIDLQAVSLMANGPARSGENLAITYQVNNLTEFATDAGWQDRIYLSSDNILDQNDLFLKTISRRGIAANGSYTETTTVKIPNGMSGNYYLIVYTDALSTAKDTVRSNNKAIYAMNIELTPPVDFALTNLNAPDNLFTRQSLMVTYTVKNEGVGPTTRSWYDGIYLSRNTKAEKSVSIGNKIQTRTLQPDESYTDSILVTIPSNLLGNYYLIAFADNSDLIFEDGSEENNQRAKIVSISIPDPADLMITSISITDTAYLGDAVKATYELKNIGSNPTVGSFTDAVYLSSDKTYNPLLNTLLGSGARNTVMQPGESKRFEIENNLHSVFPSDYYAIGRTNITNGVIESDLTNNTRASDETINVKIRELVVNIPLNKSLNTTSDLYYKIDVEEDLDMVVDLTSNYPGSHNEFYIAYNRIPTVNNFDRKGGLPQQGNQRIIIPGTQGGSYYLLVVSNYSPNPQYITLHAKTFGFSLFSAAPKKLGQGPVTNIIEGAGFREGIKFAIRKAGSSVNVSASTSVHLLNSMEAEVMWNFTNVDIGKYHLVAINPDNSEVSLSDAITIEKSTGYLLESFVSAPDLIRLGKTAYYNFTIVNNGNVDIPFVETAIATEKYARIVKMHTFGNVLSRKNYGVNKEHVEMKDFFEQDGYNVILLTSRNVKAGEKFEVSVMYENFLYNVFPVTLMAEGFNREDFMSRQLAGIEIIRNVAIYNPEFFNDPEFSLMAKDKNVFTELILNQYIDFGIIAPSDTIGLAECTTCGIPSGDDPTVVFSPGTSPGVLVLPFAEFGKNQRYKWEINNYEGFAGIWNGWDMVYTYGPIDINATPQQPFTVEVISLDFFNRPGYLGAFAPAFDKCWPIAIAKGGIKGFDANKFVIDTSAFVKYNYTYGGVFSIKLHGTDSLMLCFTARKPGIGESGIPGGPGGYGQDGAPGGDGGDGDENTPPGQGGIGGQGGYGDGNRSTGKGGKGGKGGKHHDNSKPDAPEGPDGPEGPEGPENPDSPTPPPPPPKPDGTPDGTPPQVPPPGVPPADVPPSKPPKGLPDGKPGYPHYPDLPGFPDPDRPNNPGRPDGPPGTPPAPGCSVAPTSTMSSVLCKAAPFASGIQCGISMFGCYKLFVSGGAALGLVFTPIGSVIGASAAAIIAAGTCGWSYGNCIQGKAFAGDKLKEYFCRPVVGSCDPNEIQGPVGYGPEKFVSNEEELPYRILYENDPDFATAPAQRVVITQKLDSNLDASTLRLGNFGFSNYIFDVPQGLSNYTTRLKLADSLGFDVNITAGLDVVKREIFWIFQSIDPATGLSPEDPLAGYLPVNDSTGKGEGFVTYTIKPRMNTNTGDSITAQAAIVFDINVPIITNTAWNIIDARKPVSVITNQTSVEHNSVITLNVQAADDTGGSGIRDYVLYYSENDGPFVKYDSVFTDYTISIIGNPGSNYCFFTLATDNVGHTELMKDQCELSLMLQPASPLGVNWLYFTGELNGKDAHLKWATAAESNSENFVIERSTDAIKFESIGASKAQGNTQTTTKYMYVDKNAAYVSAAVLYYRLKQVDKDGKFTYSNVVALPITKGRFAPIISVYPNPFEKVTTLMVTTSEPASPGDKVQLFSVSGVLLYERDVSGRSNNAQIVLSDLPKLATGIYFLKTYINGQVKTMKVTHL